MSVVDWSLMNFVLRPWQLFFLILSDWVNRQQQEIIEFQNAQIQALLDKIGESDPLPRRIGWQRRWRDPVIRTTRGTTAVL